MVQMAAPGSPAQNDTFLGLFGTPTLLWRVLHSVGVHGAASLLLVTGVLEGQSWYEVQVMIPARARAPQWQEWRAESEGKNPWEGAKVAVFEILSKIYQ